MTDEALWMEAPRWRELHRVLPETLTMHNGSRYVRTACGRRVNASRGYPVVSDNGWRCAVCKRRESEETR